MTTAATGLLVLSSLLSALAQIWLKESAITTHKSPLAEFLNFRVAAAYAILTSTVLINAWALRWLTFKWSVVVGSTGYIFVLFLSRRRFGETLGPARRWGVGLVLAGLCLFPL
jgi:multidrug transporter EmrE-like cation transporter